MDFLDDRWDFKIDLDYKTAPDDEAVARKNRQILMDAFDCMVAGDVDGFWAILDPDVVFHEASCLPYGGTHKGIEATKVAVGKIAANYSRMLTQFESLSASRDNVWAYQTITFTAKETGTTGVMPVVELYRFRNDKVIEWRAFYFDAPVVAKAITG